MKLDYDYVIIGSGFGGSVSALRLSEKGYKVLVIEKGKWFQDKDFPKTNWNLKKWLWEPKAHLHGFFKMTFLNHVTVLSGVGVGGGSLIYANTLPVPKKDFFNTGSWANLNDWENELKPFYNTAYKMLGAATNPKLYESDLLIKDLAKDIGKEAHFEATKVAVYFGEAGKKVADPYFNGKGPDRTGCVFCGACMTGCRYNAKNTLDKNYLYLAQQLGAEIIAEKEVFNVSVLKSKDGSEGYKIDYKSSIGEKNKTSITTKGVIFSGGVMGTVPLLLKLKETTLPNLSAAVGKNIRTNNESLLLITSTDKNPKDYSKGIAIGSILHTDKNSHLEPVRYGEGSSFSKALTMPTIHNKFVIFRLFGIIGLFFKQPTRFFKTIFSKKYAQRTTILLFMQTLDSTLQIKLGKFTKMKTVKESGPKPNAFIPEAMELGEKVGKKVNGIPYANFTDALLGTPTTAHILGGAVMAEDDSKGVIDKHNKVFGYKNMLVCDGSMISANPGVNPSLSITAISEHAMSKIEVKKG
ncbi:GMC oxidoreductase [Xanthomarina sp. F2636L]|uniref:GMC oxidoreductase n=1 Tax=Xanthomarina sp. F2636L TaxID=2996018 RepID=UPI00225E16D6|nr:GMC oxidoreductase [Xanthomarina sp. F2636L]MCX7549290.1 GMC oxidoreductase [Xanthomarina sp. F2636L]